MKRYLLRQGDKSTAGGVILEGVENWTHHGIPVAFIGAQVWCEGCQSNGYIESVGPHHPATMLGKQQALEDDICICKCSPPPVFHASQASASHIWEDEWGEMGYGASLAALLERQRATHDERFKLCDRAGNPLADTYYTVRLPSGATVKGVTDSNGYTARYPTDGARRIAVYAGHRE
ncbi:MAG: PAAR domain-containing protein [Paraburkholderia tropica]|uniref:PAAR motif-containing protein n=1 Tax=Paraburkholderia tropica TaxID=92647 RepID=A0ABX5MKX4_9BURK|nr:PAAR domain-containing protein [Paraburkholderia tropica]MBB3003902.1 putative Zn-binding protein involved in type VI secretion [Paraburkholderia tropica]MBB6322746.1 putative Zn-binding protein involved in type VI secretion [Paraburkholderia tropica]MDE1144158.1 PAAR domain-containing protein [Paraburkholderia tropica]PXX10762.1 PAAR motif-containing protein [Paraburkholderia tropica]PZW75730.1 PAAR motif-containing protein [Paraburkholderia tropica]